MKLKIHFSHKEELWNSWSHAGGILLGGIFGIIFLYWCFSEHNGWATAGIIERGTHDELIANHGVYYQLYTGAFELE